MNINFNTLAFDEIMLETFLLEEQKREQELINIFEKEYYEFPDENGMLPFNSTILNEYRLHDLYVLVNKGILQKRNCEGFAFEFTDNYINKLKETMSNIMNDKIITICYGKANIYNSREEAKKFYLECMLASDGSEHERYSSIYQDLEQGFNLCIDDEFYEDLQLGRIKLVDVENHSDLKEYISNNLEDNIKIFKEISKDSVKKDILDDNFEIKNDSIDFVIKDRNSERKSLLLRIMDWINEHILPEDMKLMERLLNIEEDINMEELSSIKIDEVINKGLDYIDEHINKEEREHVFKEQLGMDFILAREYAVDELINESKRLNEEEQTP